MKTLLNRLENRIPEIRLEIFWIEQEIAEIDIDFVLKDGSVEIKRTCNKLKLTREMESLTKALTKFERKLITLYN